MQRIGVFPPEEEIEQATASCRSCEAGYGIADGIGLFLTEELARNDLWEAMYGHLMQYLQDNPDTERALMETPLEQLSPADRYFPSNVLDYRGAHLQIFRRNLGAR